MRVLDPGGPRAATVDVAAEAFGGSGRVCAQSWRGRLGAEFVLGTARRCPKAAAWLAQVVDALRICIVARRNIRKMALSPALDNASASSTGHGQKIRLRKPNDKTGRVEMRKFLPLRPRVYADHYFEKHLSLFSVHGVW